VCAVSPYVRDVGSERGQATIEWTGLVLLVSAALGALLTFSPEVDGRRLGGSLAHAITCAARGGCAARSRAPAGSPAAPSGPPGSAAAPAGSEAARPPSSARPRPAPRPTAPPLRTPAASHALRGAGEVVKRAWIVCLGYRRYREELEHPRTPNEAMPLDEALRIANECLNPLSFFLED
jgi:hypothetical protein